MLCCLAAAAEPARHGDENDAWGFISAAASTAAAATAATDRAVGCGLQGTGRRMCRLPESWITRGPKDGAGRSCGGMAWRVRKRVKLAHLRVVLRVTARTISGACPGSLSDDLTRPALNNRGHELRRDLAVAGTRAAAASWPR
jgi:hypothetical protein